MDVLIVICTIAIICICAIYMVITNSNKGKIKDESEKRVDTMIIEKVVPETNFF